MSTPAPSTSIPRVSRRRSKAAAIKRVKAIEPVHFAGHPCDMDRILAIARRHNLKIVEDAAHAIGAARHMEGRGMTKIGTIGDLTCFSFYATKNITTAEGGAIMTEDDALAEKIAVASLHGMNKDAWKRYDKTGSWFYEIHDTGFKYNLSDVHAAIGLAQLKKCDQFMRRRTEVARAYSEAFKSEDALQVPYVEPGVEHAWHLYVLRLRPERLKVGRNQFVEMLRERGIGTSVHCIPLHTMDFYQKTYGYRTGEFPVTEDIFSRCLSLPMYAAMSADDVSLCDRYCARAGARKSPLGIRRRLRCVYWLPAAPAFSVLISANAC